MSLHFSIESFYHSGWLKWLLDRFTFMCSAVHFFQFLSYSSKFLLRVRVWEIGHLLESGSVHILYFITTSKYLLSDYYITSLLFFLPSFQIIFKWIRRIIICLSINSSLDYVVNEIDHYSLPLSNLNDMFLHHCLQVCPQNAYHTIKASAPLHFVIHGPPLLFALIQAVKVSFRRVIKDSDIEFEKNCNQETNSVYIRTAQKGTTFIFRAHNPLATRKCCNWQKLIAENVQLYVSTQLLNSCRAIEYFNCVHIVGYSKICKYCKYPINF